MSIIFFASLIIVLVVFLVLILLKNPIKRVDEAQFKASLHDVIHGNMTTNQWLVFLSLPIKNDPWLEKLRAELLVIDDEHSIRVVSQSDIPLSMFSQRGVELLREVLNKLSKRPYKDF